MPLDAINRAAHKENQPFTRNHPRSIHIWWARRPLAACRAVLFAQLVDDPSSHPEEFPTEEAQEKERQRLFSIIEEMVKWENINNEKVLEAARKEILKSCDGDPPPILDPFCGGGSIPLEAQRLGLKAYASDLNPVAVLITKALVEIPPKFADQPPVNPDAQNDLGSGSKWKGASGLAEDIRWYGNWMRDEAQKRIGHLYPKVEITNEMVDERPDLERYKGEELTVIAWLWARTVKCPNPACGATMPLVRSFWLSKKKGKKAWVEPIVKKDRSGIEFSVHAGEGEAPEGSVKRSGARCLVCESPAPFNHVRGEGQEGRMDQQLMAIVCEGRRERVYVSPMISHSRIVKKAAPTWLPNTELMGKAAVNVPLYGLSKHGDLFTSRQLVALTTFSDLVKEAREKVLEDAIAAGFSEDDVGLSDGGSGAEAYADAVELYLSLSFSRWIDLSNSICTWNVSNENIRALFSRQAIPMSWDYAELSPFSPIASAISRVFKTAELVNHLPCIRPADVSVSDAINMNRELKGITATDPPYYDNMGYADLSDFFFVWLRRILLENWPSLFQTVLTPKKAEIIASPFRFEGDRKKAKRFFENNLRRVFSRISSSMTIHAPMTLFYAFKQAEIVADTRVSTGWETMLRSLISSSLTITATWPIRSERSARSVAIGTNALASSVVLACRRKERDTARITRREYLYELKRELPGAIRMMQFGNIAPVDLAQAAIGPGMAVFSKYKEVIEADGKPMTVRTALALINQVLHEVLTEQEGDFGPDTRWALAWFEQFGFDSAAFGEAETLSKAKNTSVQGLVDAGILEARAGKVRLLRRDELRQDWDPDTDKRLTVWEVAHYLIQKIDKEGEEAASELARRIGPMAASARDLAYRLYQICDEKGWAKEARDYNMLVIGWAEVSRLSRKPVEGKTGDLFEE